MIDGVLRPLERATVSVTDRGFLYGDSVFETLRTYGGEPFALDRHLERLERSAARVHIDLPVSKDELGGEIRHAVLGAGNAESYVRVTVTRGSGELGLDPALAGAPLRVILVTPLAPPEATLYETGISAITHAARRVSDGTDAAGAKIGNYLVSVLAMREAKAVGAAEALIVDGAGRVVEGATSNVFFVTRGTLVTPPEEMGILPGITRATLLEVATTLGVPVEFRAPLVQDLARLDEVFITSSIRELLAVVRVDGVAVGDGAPGPLFVKLLAAFRSAVRAPLPR